MSNSSESLVTSLAFFVNSSAYLFEMTFSSFSVLAACDAAFLAVDNACSPTPVVTRVDTTSPASNAMVVKIAFPCLAILLLHGVSTWSAMSMFFRASCAFRMMYFSPAEFFIHLI